MMSTPALIFDDGRVRVHTIDRAPGAATAPLVAAILAADPDVPPGAVVEHTAEGVPYIHSGPAISVTHSRNLVAVAIAPAGCRVGIDAETTGRERQLRRVATRLLSPAQYPLWSATDRILLRAWTIKEAIYKAALTPGLPLHDIPLPPPVDANPSAIVTLRGHRYRVTAIPSPQPDNLLSLASLAGFGADE